MKRKLKWKVKATLLTILSIITFSLFILEINVSKDVLKAKSLTYTKASNLNYVTYLKNNSHYDSRYLKNEFNLVASLIDYFSLDYNYSYTLNEKINYKLTYDIKAILEVYDSENTTKPIEKREFKIYDKITEKGKGQIIKVDIYGQKIIYDTYNQIIQEWKKEISPDATLTIVISVNWNGKSKVLKQKLSDSCVTKFSIPISQKTIEITPPESIDETKVIKKKVKLPIWYLAIIIVTLVFFLINLINLFMGIINRKNKSKYEQKINKILREFDRAITEANGVFTKDEDINYIEVKDFMELLDVHDNVNEPIIYYQNNNDLSVFVVKTGHDIYYTLIRRSDFDE